MKSNKYNNIEMIKPELLEKKFAILREISSAIVVSDNINSITNLMLDLAISYCNAEKGSLMLVNEHGELNILTARGMDIQLMSTYKEKIGEGIAGTVAKNLMPVLVEDIDTDERFKEAKRDRYKTRSFISCPIISNNRLLGVLNINDKIGDEKYTENEFELLKIIANHAAIALDNALLMNQMRSKATELEELNKKLIETDLMKSEFIARLSHELRTPLNSVKGAIYYLQTMVDISSIQKKEFYDIITNETDNLITKVEKLLEYLMVEDETKVINKTIININDVIKELSESKSMTTLLTRKGIDLEIDGKETRQDIVGDKIMITQLFINLIEGLSHYLEKGDSITIKVEDDEYVTVTIEISRTMPDRIFPYLYEAKSIFMSDHHSELLKLHLARNVVDVHKWNLSCDNDNNKFRIILTIPRSMRQRVEAYINTSMDMFVDFISEMMEINMCSIMLNDELSNELTIKGARGLDDHIIKSTRIRMGDRISGWVALEGKPLLLEDIERDLHYDKKNIPQYNTNSLLCLPLKIDNRTIGVINLNNKRTSEPFELRDYYLAVVLCERVSQFIKRVYSGNYSDEEFKKFTSEFESLLAANKKYQKKKHKFPDLAVAIMDKLGMSDEDKKIAQYASMVYDLGLMLIDDRVLNKKELLDTEVRTLKVHPYNTVNLLNSFEFSEDVKKAILHHHERYDGTGYPDGLKGEDIPLIARVINVIDSYFAMISERPYGERYSKEKALIEIKMESGSKYDPYVVKAFEEIIDYR
jgi:HD-GYP domain-containing protein (c-di-GMP phosphodiesterase class II)/signal transduction histidine kinase